MWQNFVYSIASRKMQSIKSQEKLRGQSFKTFDTNPFHGIKHEFLRRILQTKWSLRINFIKYNRILGIIHIICDTFLAVLDPYPLVWHFQFFDHWFPIISDEYSFRFVFSTFLSILTEYSFRKRIRIPFYYPYLVW